MASANYRAIQSVLHSLVAGRSRWEETLGGLSDLVGARGIALISTYKPNLLLSSPALLECSHRYVEEGWYERDLRFRGLPRMLSTGIAVDLDYADENDFRKADYYNEFLAPHGLLWSAGVSVATRDGQCTFSVQRKREQGPFSASEQKSLLNIRHLVCNTVEVMQLLEAARIGGVLDGLEMIRVGAVAIGESGHVAHINPLAESMMPRLFRIAGGRLVFRDRHAARLFDGQFAMLAGDHRGYVATPITVRSVPSTEALPCLCYVSPPPDTWIGHPVARIRALVLLVDPSIERGPAEEQLALIFGLTPAQARIAAQLARGLSLDMVAHSSMISKETVRNHLKAIFAKTGTSRQSELVALLARVLGPHRSSAAT